MLIVFLIRVVSGCWPEFSLWPEYSHVTSPGLMGRAKAGVWWPGVSMSLTSDWPDTHNTDLWLARGLGVVSVHQPHSGTRWIADNKTDHTDSDWSEWRLCQIILTTNLWLLMSCTNLSDKLWMNSCWLFVLQPPLPPDIPIYICLCGVHCDPSCCLPWCRCFTQCEIITWDKTFVCWCSNPIMTWYRQNPTPVHLLIQNGQ